MADEKTKTGSRLDLLETELERFIEAASGELGAEQVIISGSLARTLEVGEDALGEWSDLVWSSSLGPSGRSTSGSGTC